ncbi:hypothetical protein GALL_549800 [mine drainage metagenome]|uniref:Uncharacterized protein n=1 Tax=mine drainage metagenome TaxID=410659 RepID=A0A1J5NZ13_9ZZZZ
MRGDDVIELVGRDVFAHGQAQLVVGHVPARIEDHSLVVIDDQELVGLHRLVVRHEIGEHDTGVMGVFIEFDGHGGFKRNRFKNCRGICQGSDQASAFSPTDCKNGASSAWAPQSSTVFPSWVCASTQLSRSAAAEKSMRRTACSSRMMVSARPA